MRKLIPLVALLATLLASFAARAEDAALTPRPHGFAPAATATGVPASPGDALADTPSSPSSNPSSGPSSDPSSNEVDALLARDRPPPSFSVGETLMPFIKTMLMLGVVLGIVYLTLHKGMGKLVQRAQAGKRVKVIERVSLDARRSLFLIDVDGRQMLLGGGDNGVVHLTDVLAADGASTKTDAAPGRPGLFATMLGQRGAAPPLTTGLSRSKDDDVTSKQEAV